MPILINAGIHTQCEKLEVLLLFLTCPFCTCVQVLHNDSSHSHAHCWTVSKAGHRSPEDGSERGNQAAQRRGQIVTAACQVQRSMIKDGITTNLSQT